MKKTTLLSPFVMLIILSLSTTAFAGGDRNRFECYSNGVDDTSMDARFEERLSSNRIKFDASFEAALDGVFVEGDIVYVFVYGVYVGNMTLFEDSGDLEGDLEFDNQADELNPFPLRFPILKVGNGTSVVIVSRKGIRLGCTLKD